MQFLQWSIKAYRKSLKGDGGKSEKIGEMTCSSAQTTNKSRQKLKNLRVKTRMCFVKCIRIPDVKKVIMFSIRNGKISIIFRTPRPPKMILIQSSIYLYACPYVVKISWLSVIYFVFYYNRYNIKNFLVYDLANIIGRP